MTFTAVAPFLQDQLVLIGFFIFVAIGFVRMLFTHKVIPKLPAALGFRILRLVFVCGFIFGFLLLFLGFTLQYRQLQQPTSAARRELYSAFIVHVQRDSAPLLSELLSLGSFARRVSTDMDIQLIESRLELFVSRWDVHDVYQDASDAFRPIKVYGSPKLQMCANDILAALALNPAAATSNLRHYPEVVRTLLDHWSDYHNQSHMGFEPRIDDRERASIVVASGLFDYLLELMNEEIRSG
jgi:hypothetical protein